MQKLLFIFTTVLFFQLLPTKAQTYFVPTAPGTTLLYKNYDSKGKPVKVDKKDDWQTQTVEKTEKSGDTTIVYIAVDGAAFQTADAKSNAMIESIKKLKFKITKDSVYFSIDPFFAAMGNMVSGASGGQAEMNVKSKLKGPVFPVNLKPGDKLDDFISGYIEYSTSAAGMNFSFTSVTTEKDRIIEGEENVTTPAGTFKCYKYRHTSTFEMKGSMMNQKQTTKNITWMNPEVGIVKSENYNDKGKLESRQVLEKIEKK
ncbi:MAG: hypothetical protein LBQ60_18875 [Bacteroidales bacterium]|nr:hypothetical protein [Bacteroidales bacterium]